MIYAKLGNWMDPTSAIGYLSLLVKERETNRGETRESGAVYAVRDKSPGGADPLVGWRSWAYRGGRGKDPWQDGELDTQIYDNGGAIVIRAELPGVDIKDIHIDMMDNVLTIRIDNFAMHARRQGREGGRRKAESYQKSFVLPRNVFLFPEMVKATLTNGIFKLEILKCSE